MVETEVFTLENHFVGEPKPEDLKLQKFELPALKDGDILTEAVYLSVDPYMRQYNEMFRKGDTMFGGQVAMIIESKNPNYPAGKYIVGFLGWARRRVFNPDALENEVFSMKPYLCPNLGRLPLSLTLGALGLTGNTAYFGFTQICEPKAGETLVVSGAAGAVGSHVGQIGKIMGLKVIGIAGSDEKCKWLVKKLKFDHAINYKTSYVESALKQAAPNGVDCFFDNVGGDLFHTVVRQMNKPGRVSLCGCISSYNDMTGQPKNKILRPEMSGYGVEIEAFKVNRWSDRWMEGIEKNAAWIREGKLRYRETVTDGFENMFKAFAGMLKGENIGKAIVRA